MKKLLLFIALALVYACSPPAEEPEVEITRNDLQPPSADLVMLGGQVYIPGSPQHWAEAVVVSSREIVYVGDDGQASQFSGPDTVVIQLEGRMVLPGFHDAHTHTMLGGRMLLGCSLMDLGSVDAVLRQLETCNEDGDQDGNDDWLIADNWDVSLFGANGPDKALLDAIVPNRPVVARASDGHSYWVNSRALELAGMDAGFNDPPSGLLERYENGEPSGTLREAAIELIDALLPVPSAEQDLAALLAAIQAMNAVGITSIFDAWAGSADIAAYQALQARGQLSLRARLALNYAYGAIYALDSSERYEQWLQERNNYTTDRFSIPAVKLFIDGVLEGETAALVDPYLGMGDYRGSFYFEQQELNRVVAELEAQGLQIHTHSLGDGAVRATLDAFEYARAVNGPRDLRHHISHLQLIHPDDIGRFAELGAVANFQALWAIPNEWITVLNLPVVGQERVDRMYPIASVERAGGVVVGGSDWNVSSMNPLEAIEVGMLRSNPYTNGTAVAAPSAALGEAELSVASPAQAAVLNANERVSLQTMIAAYTSQAAWSMHQEQLTGRLEAGKRADMVVLDRNLFDIPPETISEAQVVLTLLDGEVVYRAAGFGVTPPPVYRP